MSLLAKNALASAKAAFDAVEKAHELLQVASYELGMILQHDATVLDESTLTDVGFLYREMEDYLNAARKEAANKKKLVGQVIAVKITKRTLQGGDLYSEGDMAKAIPDVKVRPALPRKFSDEYHKLLGAMGVDKESRDLGLLSLNWKRISDWLTEKAAKGEPSPLGFELTTNEMTVTYRRKARKTK